MTFAVASRLDALEGVIERGLATFVEVGEALLEIRDSRLYRETHGTFEDYCRERWGMSRPRAYNLIDAAKVTHLVSANADIPNEAVARELVPVMRQEPDALPDVMAEATERAGGQPTAVDVRDVVRERYMPRVTQERTAELAPPPLRPSITVVMQAFRRDLQRLLDAYTEMASDPAFAAAYGPVLDAISHALEEMK